MMVQNIKKGGITYEEYNSKYRLPEQARDEELLLKNKHHILCYEPGKGKSMPVIHCIQEVNKKMNGNAKVLIMSDATCIKSMWKAEILPMGVLPKDTLMVTDRTAIGKLKDILLDTKWDIIVCDECQSLRSGVTRAKSKYAKLVYTLTKRTEYVWGMTGTIAGNNDIEPFCVLHNLNVAGMGDINCFAFKNNYCVKELQYGPFGAFEKPTKLNKKGLEIMNNAYEKGCSFWEYDENDNMPPMNITTKTFEVPKTKFYEDALIGIFSVGDNESTFMKSIALQKAQQALNGFIYYDNEETKRNTFIVTEFHNPKLDYVVDECKKDLQIITYRFEEDARYIRKALDDNKILYCEDIEEFKNRAGNGEHIILVLQCSRGKAANIQVCRNIIYYSSDFSFISYKQMIHRCWRRGQTEPCNVTFLVNEPKDDEEKVEFKIWQSLRRKQSIHDLLMSIKNKEEV